MTPTRCGAKTRDGDPCKSYVVIGATRCRMHGGTQPVGIASPNYKHGRRSKYLPKRMLETYEDARTDPELLNLTHDLATVESRISDVLSRVESGDAGQTWTKLAQTWDAFLIAQRAKNAQKSAEALATVGRLIETGAGDWAAWREIMDLIERRRKLVESEAKRRMQMADMTDNREVIALLDRLADAVVRHVPDHDARVAIQDEILAVLGGGVLRGSAGGD